MLHLGPYLMLEAFS